MRNLFRVAGMTAATALMAAGVTVTSGNIAQAAPAKDARVSAKAGGVVYDTNGGLRRCRCY